VRAVNLIPAEQRTGGSAGAGRSQGAVYLVLALLAGVAVLAVLYGVARHQVESRRSKAASLTAQVQRAQAEASRLAPYTSFIALREAREQAVMQLVNSRFDWAHAFHELGRVLPAGVSIASLNGIVGTNTPGSPGAGASSSTTSAAGAASSSPASSTPPGSVPVFTLSGCAISQPTVAVLLGRLRLIDGVSEVTLQSSTKNGSGASNTPSGSGTAVACPIGAPVFTVTVTFQPLPASTATASAPAGATAAAVDASGATGAPR
jgi:Tfp pilus assembly protein PilN